METTIPCCSTKCLFPAANLVIWNFSMLWWKHNHWCVEPSIDRRELKSGSKMFILYDVTHTWPSLAPKLKSSTSWRIRWVIVSLGDAGQWIESSSHPNLIVNYDPIPIPTVILYWQSQLWYAFNLFSNKIDHFQSLFDYKIDNDR